ncbi:hypothetical protein N7520_007851 [Penicillium odoratum]|uniref:uncharacterized protein n=1 Tax=Penicillium odoratum TaxID=1167516 RepID=UPI002548E37F|nr:uncharacterized protein N7520_007851 [Penicillium odoratum]KAJ5760695.1 hypothetical protein N7520_007851 [Penicillium odoratum]
MEIAVGFLPSRSLRMPPQTNYINATIMIPVCLQIATGTVFAKYEPGIITASGMSEEYLTTHLPVIICFYGGERVSGGTDVPAWYPAPWVGRSQEHIVVAVQNRVSVLDFPASRALKDQDLDILDRRAGNEWVHKNIAQLGVIPAQMSLWGQSAGAGSVDIQNFAYPGEPHVKGLVANPDSALLTLDTRWTENLGTNSPLLLHTLAARHELNCPRKVPVSNITAYRGSLNDSGLKFSPFNDNRVIFNNYTERYLGKHLSNKPAIFVSRPKPWPCLPLDVLFHTQPPFDNIWGRLPTATSTASGLGAYHTAELPLIFGTSSIYGPDTLLEKDVSAKMQDRWLAFAKDPENGLSQHGWPGSTNREVLLLVDSVNQIVSSMVADNVIDNACTSYYSSFLV